MVCWCSLCVACDDSHSFVLYSLKDVVVSCCKVWRPSRTGVFQNRKDVLFVYKCRVSLCCPKSVPVALSKLLNCEGGAGAEGAILPYVGHLQLISTLKICADCCQLCQYKLTKPDLTYPNPEK